MRNPARVEKKADEQMVHEMSLAVGYPSSAKKLPSYGYLRCIRTAIRVTGGLQLDRENYVLLLLHPRTSPILIKHLADHDEAANGRSSTDNIGAQGVHQRSVNEKRGIIPKESQSMVHDHRTGELAPGWKCDMAAVMIREIPTSKVREWVNNLLRANIVQKQRRWLNSTVQI
ncbi:hypothetical protein K432DRAFT_390126 [Lepidopterella palustris CBS 459.81]|uniref:Uncharacterized protein n=1 Tax=Lepidopterella palustris CBS 459.81 TaxID=1314670 RepID=A0A8E2EGT6_9PEZI|nr:hypothetical protein K432DRAFT_390126 [Lepidopterella palustris CBS 459.81]